MSTPKEPPLPASDTDESSTSPSTKGHIGIDESGKGDFFGPLVIAAVFVDSVSKDELKLMQVRDSKKISDNRILEMSRDIRQICPHALVAIGPDRYNQLYSKIKNLNRLLAWGHARSLENLLEKVDCHLAIADQFGDERLIQRALMEKGKQIQLIQRTKAEADIAVAAASILARAEFLTKLSQLSKMVGTTLPKGASSAVELAGRMIVKKHGMDSLGRVAKLHFKTTQTILKSAGTAHTVSDTPSEG
jgi:ribonuclease HIII